MLSQPMTAFAYFRLPYKHHATVMEQTDGIPEVLPSVSALDGKSGFVIAPFSASKTSPVILLHPNKVRFMNTEGKEGLSQEEACVTTEGNKEDYAADFHVFHAALQDGSFQKLVLARCAHAAYQGQLQELFLIACRRYPRLFVALVHTEQTGTWLMATPEVLLEGKGMEYATMALAGTQQAKPTQLITDYPIEGVAWSEKNREEQQYVADYIARIIRRFTDDITEKGPYTTMAAQLYHLRTDFLFHLSDNQQLGKLLDALYPTPAVCGIPKKEAKEFILQHEHTNRKYYSGFVGMLSPEGDTHLYVSLRCMNIHPNGACDLYAGGGLLKESELQAEWEETEAKLNTMRTILH